jgi:hypothetical protein
MDNTVLDMFHGLYGPPDGNRKLQVSTCATYASVVREVRSSSCCMCAVVACSSVTAGKIVASTSSCKVNNVRPVPRCILCTYVSCAHLRRRGSV